MAKIMIVDDSLVMRKKLKDVMVRAGHQVIAEAETGVQALRDYGQYKPDVVTMDITMPNMSGIEAVKKIIAAYPDAKIVMVSAMGQREMVLEAVQNGAVNYILKPIEEEKVIQVINKVAGENPKEKPKPQNEESVKEESVPQEDNAEAFSIENKDGVFVISINSNINDNTHHFISTAVQGLLFIKPLKVIFNFGDIETLKEEIIKNIADILATIRNSGGALKVISKNQKFIDSFASKKHDFSVSLCSDISNVKF